MTQKSLVIGIGLIVVIASIAIGVGVGLRSSNPQDAGTAKTHSPVVRYEEPQLPPESYVNGRAKEMKRFQDRLYHSTLNKSQ